MAAGEVASGAQTKATPRGGKGGGKGNTPRADGELPGAAKTEAKGDYKKPTPLGAKGGEGRGKGGGGRGRGRGDAGGEGEPKENGHAQSQPMNGHANGHAKVHSFLFCPRTAGASSFFSGTFYVFSLLLSLSLMCVLCRDSR